MNSGRFCPAWDNRSEALHCRNMGSVQVGAILETDLTVFLSIIENRNLAGSARWKSFAFAGRTLAVFQFSDFTLKYELHLQLVSRDTLLIYRSDQAQPWKSLLDFWKSKTDGSKTGKLCVLVLPSPSEQKANNSVDRELHAVGSLLEAVGFEDVVFMGQATAGYMAMEMASRQPARVKKIVVVDPTPYQWEGCNKPGSESLKGIEKEVLVLQGAFDKSHPKTGAREFVKSLPNARVLEMSSPSNDAIYDEINSFI